MPKTTGRLVILSYAIGKPSDNPASLTFGRLGAMRDKNIEFVWDTVDSTTDDSADFTKEELVTFKAVNISGSGLYNDDDSSNIEALESHILSPGVLTDYQPHAWVTLAYPSGRTFRGCFLFKSWKVGAGYADPMTFNVEAASAGAVTRIA